MAKTIKITSSNEISVVDVDFDDYRAIQKVVGGMFETVKTQRMFDYFGKPVMMLVDEEGILKQLPLNRTGIPLLWVSRCRILSWQFQRMRIS